MGALLLRNIKLYFANIPSVIISCLGALISFFIYIGFLKENLLSAWQHVANATEILDLWIMAGITAITAITTSFQALGQMIKDKEKRIAADISLTDLTWIRQNFAYVFSSCLVSILMQIITLLVMGGYFKLVDKITLPFQSYPGLIIFIIVGAIVATLLNMLIIFLIHSTTTFTRVAAIISAVSGFAVGAYVPYGALSAPAQNLVKWVPNSYEAAGLRSLLLDNMIKEEDNGHISEYLGIHFKLNGHQLSELEGLYLMLGLSFILACIVVGVLLISKRRD